MFISTASIALTFFKKGGVIMMLFGGTFHDESLEYHAESYLDEWKILVCWQLIDGNEPKKDLYIYDKRVVAKLWAKEKPGRSFRKVYVLKMRGLPDDGDYRGYLINEKQIRIKSFEDETKSLINKSLDKLTDDDKSLLGIKIKEGAVFFTKREI